MFNLPPIIVGTFFFIGVASVLAIILFIIAAVLLFTFVKDPADEIEPLESLEEIDSHKDIPKA